MAGNAEEQLLRELYGKFGAGDLPGVLAMCTDDIIFRVPGTSPLAGEYTKGTFAELIGKVMQLSRGTFREELVDVIANKDHAVALLDHAFERNGANVLYRTDHIWQLRDGKFCGWLERPGDEAAFDRVWS